MQIAGRIKQMGEVLQILAFGHKSGVLKLSGRGREGSIAFKDGKIVRASSSMVKKGVCDLLVEGGIVTADQVRVARDIQRARDFTESVGDILVKDLKIYRKMVDDAATALIEKVVLSFFLWTGGSFVFEPGGFMETPEVLKDDPLHYTLPLGINPQFLAVEGSRLLDEHRKEGRLMEEEDTSHEAPPASRLKGLHLLKEMLVELGRPQSEGEIVLSVLRFSSEIMDRAVVFAVKEDGIVGLGQFGIAVRGSAVKRGRKMRLPLTEPSILKEVLDRKAALVKRPDPLPWNDYILRGLGGYMPSEAFVAPITVQGEVAMILYGDNAPHGEKIGDTSTLEIFLAQAGTALERIVLEKRLSGEG
jgi:hypothetical protein